MKKLLSFVLMCLVALSEAAITSGGTMSATPSQPAPTVKKRTTVEVVYGYLKVFPHELGVFEAEPSSVIAQINRQAQHGYNNWRIPTNEELSLLRANGYLGSGQYMSRERKNGIVLLVSDGDDFVTVQKAEEEARRAANEARKAEEAQKAALRAQGWIDLGLPSGTLWKDRNEEGGLYTYDQAVEKFGNSLPTKEQLEELKDVCRWIWKGSGYKAEGPSGEAIVLPGDGYSGCDGGVYGVGSGGYYWSSTFNGLEGAWNLSFKSGRMDILNNYRCYGLSVRLVKNP